MEIWKDSLESLKDLIEIHETKLILEQNYTFFLSFKGMILSSSNTFLKIVTFGEEIIVFHQGVLDSLHNQEHSLWNYT